MAKGTRIEWAHHTFNPWIGCAKVSEACKNCYAERQQTVALKGIKWGLNTDRYLKAESGWREPLAWNREAAKLGVRYRVFCASLADVFEDRRDLDSQRERLWKLIDATPHLDWLLVTKRIDLVGEMVPWGQSWPANVWLGCTVENQRRVDERLPHLLKYPAVVRFISAEPLLESIELSRYLHGLDWVITGGESDNRKDVARATPAEWFRKLRDQVTGAGVPFFFKQWGNHAPDGSGQLIQLRSKKDAEPILDGVRWTEVPEGREKRGPIPVKLASVTVIAKPVPVKAVPDLTRAQELVTDAELERQVRDLILAHGAPRLRKAVQNVEARIRQAG